eukprot:3812652-Pleurochrysis_carterae.AAC.1
MRNAADSLRVETVLSALQTPSTSVTNASTGEAVSSRQWDSIFKTDSFRALLRDLEAINTTPLDAAKAAS